MLVGWVGCGEGECVSGGGLCTLRPSQDYAGTLTLGKLSGEAVGGAEKAFGGGPPAAPRYGAFLVMTVVCKNKQKS